MGEADEEAVKKSLQQLEEKLAGYERILAKQKYIAGDVSHFPFTLFFHPWRKWRVQQPCHPI